MKNGKFIEIENEGIFWYKDGEPHRVDGPAIEWDEGSWFWYNNGMKHRNDGPASFLEISKYLNGGLGVGKFLKVNLINYQEIQIMKFIVNNQLI